MVSINRRAFLATSATIAAEIVLRLSGGGSQINDQLYAATPLPVRNSLPTDEMTLAARAARKGLQYGAATNHRFLRTDPAFAHAFARECSILVPEFEFKWSRIRPSAETFDFSASDWLFEFAEQHGLQVRGHPLVWHQALPRWFDSTVTPQNAERILVHHITTIVRRYAGRVHSWDVVNEAILPSRRSPDGLINSAWLKFLGPDYIDLAFRVAAEADPNAVLVLNDYGLDYETRHGKSKRRLVLSLLERLVAAGTPVHALGIQAHLRAWEDRFKPAEMQKFLQSVADLGLDVFVTELDVSDQKLPGQIEYRDEKVARVYRDYLDTVLSVPAVKLVITWGLSDRYTWLQYHRPRSDGLDVRPLPLDSDLQRKPAWTAIASAFDRASHRESR